MSEVTAVGTCGLVWSISQRSLGPKLAEKSSRDITTLPIEACLYQVKTDQEEIWSNLESAF